MHRPDGRITQHLHFTATLHIGVMRPAPKNHLLRVNQTSGTSATDLGGVSTGNLIGTFSLGPIEGSSQNVRELPTNQKRIPLVRGERGGTCQRERSSTISGIRASSIRTKAARSGVILPRSTFTVQCTQAGTCPLPTASVVAECKGTDHAHGWPDIQSRTRYFETWEWTDQGFRWASSGLSCCYAEHLNFLSTLTASRTVSYV